MFVEPGRHGNVDAGACVPAWMVPVAGKDTVPTANVFCRKEKFESQWANGAQVASMQCDLSIRYIQLREDLEKSNLEVEITRPQIEVEITAKQMKAESICKVPSAKARAKAKGEAKAKSVPSRDSKWSALPHMFK